MSLIPIICTHEVSSKVLSSILSTAYEAASQIDSPPSLILLTTSDGDELRKYTKDSVTNPPVESFQSPFLDWKHKDIAKFLQENTSKTVIDRTTFLVADQQTITDEDTLLLVYSIEGDLETLRLSVEFVNSQAVSVSIATTDLAELRSLADEDGVYRGGPQRPPPKKGGKAPRKQLRLSHTLNHELCSTMGPDKG
ncbi:hypothetical protein BDW74DRAFT_154947 [Aspergillus multicolor]|uniref:uncharacterized protein n=1 Tax=Aspergillus multicolor TaxID=41759 RepID=UPI003CCD5C97